MSKWQKRKGIMLCQPLDERNLKRNFELSQILLVQPKLDGHRCWVRWEGERPVLISSQGNEITSMLHINMALRELAEVLGERIEFDGELYTNYTSFETISSCVARANWTPKCASIQFHIFDFKGYTEVDGERQQSLNSIFHTWRVHCPAELDNVLMRVPTYPVYTQKEIDGYLNTFLSKSYEGIIIRNPMAQYVEKRPFTILKWKPGREDEYTIVATNEAISEAGIPLGYLGSLTCRDRWGNEFNVGCGQGIDLPIRTTYWEHRHHLIGAKATVQYQNLTKYGVPRFGKFISIHIDLEHILAEGGDNV